MSDAGKMTWEEFVEVKKSQPLFKFSVITGSMVPVLQVGETVVVDVDSTIDIHDIIVFWQDGKLVCHTVWRKNRIIRDEGEEVWVTRGIASNMMDLSIKKSEILGKVISHKLPLWWKLKLRWRELKLFGQSQPFH
ncbi:MAG: S24/S26 family peptidase [Bacteriovoracaceae bacterium]|nr:S24/S26 family peptidase [Bacteriovoracaceae bacterium]